MKSTTSLFIKWTAEHQARRCVSMLWQLNPLNHHVVRLILKGREALHASYVRHCVLYGRQ